MPEASVRLSRAAAAAGERPGRSRKDVLRDFRRDQIVEAAWEVIGELGYAEASIDRIAERAGVARSTVYVYFASKDEILHACFARGRAQLGERIRAALEDPRGLAARLEAFVSGMLGYVDENREFFRALVVVQGPAAFFPEQRDVPGELATLRDETQRTLRALLEQGMASGELPHQDPAPLGDLLGNLLYGAVMRRSYAATTAPAGHQARELVHAFLFGVARRRLPNPPPRSSP